MVQRDPVVVARHIVGTNVELGVSEDKRRQPLTSLGEVPDLGDHQSPVGSISALARRVVVIGVGDALDQRTADDDPGYELSAVVVQGQLDLSLKNAPAFSPIEIISLALSVWPCAR